MKVMRTGALGQTIDFIWPNVCSVCRISHGRLSPNIVSEHLFIVCRCMKLVSHADWVHILVDDMQVAN